MSDDPRAQPPAGPVQELREGWRLLAFAVLIMVVSSGTWHSFSVFYVALLDDTGWDRSSTAGVFSVMVLVYGATGVWSGALTDRLGARRVILAGATILAAGLLLDARVRAPWQLYLSHGVVVGIGQAGVGWIPFTVLIPRFFRRSLGVAIGIVSAGAGLGIAIVVPLSQGLIRWLGWRAAFAMLAGLAVAVAAPLALVGLRGPYGDRAPLPDTSPGTSQPPRRTGLAAALRDVRFWALTAAAALMSFGVQTLTVHHVAALVDAGVAAMMAASTIGVMGLTSIPAKVGWGWLADRLGRPLTFGLGVLVFLAAVTRLGTIGAGTGGAGVVAYGILIGLGYSMSATLTPVLAADLFHGVRYGAILGTVNFLSQVGGAFGVWFAGFLHDLTGSYRLSLALAAAAALVAAGVVIGPAARGRRRWR